MGGMGGGGEGGGKECRRRIRGRELGGMKEREGEGDIADMHS